MVAKKRALEDTPTAQSSKKVKAAHKDKSARPAKSKAEEPRNSASQVTSSLVHDEVDFPRGGGTNLTPFEVKTIQREGLEEADKELFKERTASKKKRKSEKKVAKSNEQGTIRVEHLNYKRLDPGMKVLGQVVAVHPLALIVSLPNQLLAHVPITNITSKLTERLESLDQDADDASDVSMNDDTEADALPDLDDMFKPGQYVRAVVAAVHSQGSSFAGGTSSRSRDEMEKNSRRVELSLVPSKVNVGIAKADLKPGMTLSAALQSVEDHGYILDIGVENASGFLPIADAGAIKPQLGTLLDVSITRAASNGRIFTCSVDPGTLAQSHISDVTNTSSIIPGLLVHGLITAVLPNGLNLQILGFLEGSVDEYHITTGHTHQIGEKVKARVLYQSNQSTPPKFALSLAEHVVKLDTRQHSTSEADTGTPLADAFPIGTTLDAVQVLRVESERGLIVEVEPNLLGFVHISQVSDDHVPTLPTNAGPWKVGTIHRARVTGYIMFDGLLQLSCRPSILDRKFLQVSDMAVGTVVKGTIKTLADSAMFVSLSGSVDGVIWPNHYADIPLKHPAKRFRPGGSVKCRVLVVDPERNRIALTAKKTLVESTLPIITNWESVQVGVITHAVVFKVGPKSLQVEFYNNMKAIVPVQEASESSIPSLSDVFSPGKPVKVRITSVDVQERKIVASIRQAVENFVELMKDVSEVDVGNVVEGKITDIHKENVVLSLQPTQIRALLSLNNLANRQGVSATKIRASLANGQTLRDLVVVSKNAEKGFVIVASKPKKADRAAAKSTVTWDTVQVGQTVQGRVIGHSSKGSMVKIAPHMVGALHPTDCSDNYNEGTPFPAVDSTLTVVVISMDKGKKQLHLSTRPSRLTPDADNVVTDPEINELSSLKAGDTVRGFIKNIADHGVFVYVGRGIDARVQIKELFDDFVKDWQPRFQVNQVVKGRILSLNPDKQQIDLTFRSSAHPANSSKLNLSDLSPGQKVRGRVKKVADYGMFIQIEDSSLSGLCHKSELSDNAHADVALALRSFHEGDAVKAVILSVDEQKRQISLGLKPSYFDQEDFDDAPDASSSVDETLGVGDLDAGNADSDAGGDGDVLMDGIDTQAPLESDSSDEEENLVLHHLSTATSTRTTGHAFVAPAGSSATPLQLGTGFQWSATPATDEAGGVSDDSSQSEAEEGTSHRKKRRRKQIEQDLTADMHSKIPQSIPDFERVLLGSPNSSFLWIQYMSFQLQLAEVDTAREVARRALRTIGFREEQEKLNVWIAMLNLENAYGSDETLEATFKEAARANDSKTIHLRLATILNQSGKTEKAQERFQRTCKKFGQSCKVWCLYGQFHMEHGKLEDARALLPRSLQSLEKRKHLKTISRFAQLEYKLGEPERGRTIFEGIIDSHPKRLDLWYVYIDMEATQNDITHIRQLFDRVLALKMTSHKAKALLKKWLDLERRLGDEEGQDLVKERAIAWTQQASSS